MDLVRHIQRFRMHGIVMALLMGCLIVCHRVVMRIVIGSDRGIALCWEIGSDRPCCVVANGTGSDSLRG